MGHEISKYVDRDANSHATPKDIIEKETRLKFCEKWQIEDVNTFLLLYTKVYGDAIELNKEKRKEQIEELKDEIEQLEKLVSIMREEQILKHKTELHIREEKNEESNQGQEILSMNVNNTNVNISERDLGKSNNSNHMEAIQLLTESNSQGNHKTSQIAVDIKEALDGAKPMLLNNKSVRTDGIQVDAIAVGGSLKTESIDINSRDPGEPDLLKGLNNKLEDNSQSGVLPLSKGDTVYTLEKSVSNEIERKIEVPNISEVEKLRSDSSLDMSSTEDAISTSKPPLIKLDAKETRKKSRFLYLHEKKKHAKGVKEPKHDKMDMYEDTPEMLESQIAMKRQTLYRIFKHSFPSMNDIDFSTPIQWSNYFKAAVEVTAQAKFYSDIRNRQHWHPASNGYEMIRDPIAASELEAYMNANGKILPPIEDHEIDGYTDDNASISDAGFGDDENDLSDEEKLNSSEKLGGADATKENEMKELGKTIFLHKASNPG